MKAVLAALLIAATGEPSLPTADPAAPRELDVVTPKSGRPFGGRIVAITAETVRMQVVLIGDRGRGTVARSIPMDQVDRIRFGLSGEEERALAAPEGFETGQLLGWWNDRRTYLRYPRSRAGRFGLAYAARLLGGDGPRDAEKALETCDAVLAFDWNEDHKAEARVLRLRCLLALGRAEEAVNEAGRLAEQTDDPAMLIEARHVLALDDRERLAALERENPRWAEDDEVLPVRRELFSRALDGFLFPFLFHGSRTREAARGLARASELCAAAGAPGPAAAFARDLLGLYPGTPEAESIRSGAVPALPARDPSLTDNETDAPEKSDSP